MKRMTLEKAAGLTRMHSEEGSAVAAAGEDGRGGEGDGGGTGEEEEGRLREDADAYMREKERIRELRRAQQEEEREARERKRQEFEKIVAEKRKRYESEPMDEEDMENATEPPPPTVTRRPMLLIGKMPGRKKKEEKKIEEEEDKKGISIKLAGGKAATKKTSVLNILEATKQGPSSKVTLSKSALLERSQALLDAVKKRKLEEAAKNAEEQVPLDYEGNIQNFVRSEEERTRKAKQALEDMARQEAEDEPMNIPLPPPIDPAIKEEEEDMAMLGIDKSDDKLNADKVRAPPPVSDVNVQPEGNGSSEPAKATATASAAKLGSIFYGASQPGMLLFVS